MDGVFFSGVSCPCPSLAELCDRSEYDRLVREIEASGVSGELREFLLLAAVRWVRFRFDRIAAYYQHAPEPIKRLFESQALVILDRDRAIERGLLRLSDRLKKLLGE